MKTERKLTRKVCVRGLEIGGGAPVSIQSMTNLPIEDVAGTIAQIKKLNSEGAGLVRIAVRNEESVAYLKEIRKAIETPLSADVHFNYKIAVKSIEAGIDKIRINPGNIGSEEKVKEVLRAAKDHSVPIRVGVNGGSVDKKKYSEVTAQALVDSAMEHVKILEDNDFFDIVVSIKSSDISETIEANEIFSSMRDYPLHLGLTEAGYGLSCAVQSSVTIGHLLLEGIGDTIRVSMTGDPLEEVVVAKKILEAAGERKPVLRIISCPTCGRTDTSIDVLSIVKSIEEKLAAKYVDILIKKKMYLTIAVMGCEVNGPGEASHADFGLAGGREGEMLLFSHGEKLRKVKAGDAVFALMDEIDRLI